VRSTVGIYGTWVHWSMTVDANRAIQHYINGVVNNGPQYSTSFCANGNGGFLVLGHDQDSAGGGLDGNQVRPPPPHTYTCALDVHTW